VIKKNVYDTCTGYTNIVWRKPIILMKGLILMVHVYKLSKYGEF